MRKSARVASAAAAADRPPSGAARHVLVVCAMTLVAAAIGLGLNHHLEITTQTAAIAAGVAWIGFLLLHIMMHRGRSAATPQDDLTRLSAEIASLKQAGAARPAQGAPARPAHASPVLETATRLKPPPIPRVAREAPVRKDGASQHATAPTLSAATNAPDLGSLDAARQQRESTELAPNMGWDLRPGARREPLATEPKPAAFPPLDRPAGQGTGMGAPQAQRPELQAPLQPALQGEPMAAPRATTSNASDRDATRSAELRSMQSLIEQIARQLTAPADAPSVAKAEGPAQPLAAEQAIAQSVEALKAVGNAMRTASAGAIPDPARPARDRSPKGTKAAVLPQIAEAIAAQRLDTYLDYIFGLEDRKAHLFEISFRIRTEDGRSLGPSDCAPQLEAGGLHGRFDAAKLTLLAKIGERLNSRGTNASLFSSLAPMSLIDDSFLDTCASILRNQPVVGRQLVLSFAQKDVRIFAKPHWETLATLAENGARFAVEDVLDLTMDFAMLKSRGFSFVRTDAPTLLAGMHTPDGLAPAVQVCKRIAEAGLGLIARAIHDETTLAQVLGLGVPYGQGSLFGATRPVKIDLKQPQEAAA